MEPGAGLRHVFTQPVIHDFPRFSMPVALLIGGKDRTAPGANRAPKDVAQRLGNSQSSVGRPRR